MYVQNYRKEWELDTQFKNWLSGVTGEPSKALWKFCTLVLNAKLSDVKIILSQKNIKIIYSVFLGPDKKTLAFKPITDNDPTKIAEGSNSLFIAEHCSFLTTDHFE